MKLHRLANHRLFKILSGTTNNSFHVLNNLARMGSSSPPLFISASPSVFNAPMPIRISNQLRLIHTSGWNAKEKKTEEMLPQLMDFPEIVWPKVINTIRSGFCIDFIIKPYFDKEFSIHDFITGSKQAVSVISTKLSEGKLDELDGLVESLALAQLKNTTKKFTTLQQQLLRVDSADIFFTFPYKIKVILPNNRVRPITSAKPKPPRRQIGQLEIIVCFHVFRGFHKLVEQRKEGQTQFYVDLDDENNRRDLMICNYRFIKDYSEDNPDPSWIVDKLNHFLLADWGVGRR